MNRNLDGRIRISILMVTYNSERFLNSSLGPLINMPQTEIIVVDNASQDGTVSTLKRDFRGVTVFESPTNLGFGAAMNIAANAAQGEMLLLLNPDAEVTVETLMELADRNGVTGGISAPVIIQPNGRLSIHSAGRFPTIWRMFLHFSGASRLSLMSNTFEGHYFIPQKIESQCISADWVTGAVLLISRDTWLKVGGLTERWFMYAEDIDLCWSVREHGEPVHLYTDLNANHLVGASDSTDSFSANSAWIVNLLDFYRWKINSNPYFGFVWCIVVAVGLLSRSVQFGLRGRRAGKIDKNGWIRESRRFRCYAKDIALSIRILKVG